MKNLSRLPCPNCKTDVALAVYKYESGWQHVECEQCHYLGPGEGSRKQAESSHNDKVCEAIYYEAHVAGLAAQDPIEDTGPVGFAKVRIPGTSKFARWVRAQGLGVTRTYGMFGTGTWLTDQSPKQARNASDAYIKAFADVLNSYGFQTFTWTWMD